MTFTRFKAFRMNDASEISANKEDFLSDWDGKTTGIICTNTDLSLPCSYK